MPQVNDIIHTKITKATSGESTYNGKVRFYLSNLGVPNYRSINDGEREALKKANNPLSVNDNWWRYFKDTTPAVSGTLNDRKLAFWNARTPV